MLTWVSGLVRQLSSHNRFISRTACTYRGRVTVPTAKEDKCCKTHRWHFMKCSSNKTETSADTTNPPSIPPGKNNNNNKKTKINITNLQDTKRETGHQNDIVRTFTWYFRRKIESSQVKSSQVKKNQVKSLYFTVRLLSTTVLIEDTE